MKREPLIQLKYRRSPWRVLVACVLLNRTRGTVAKPVIEEIFRRWPTAKALSGADSDELTELIRPLGLQHQRALSLIYLSRAYNPRKRYTRGGVLQLAGVGEYAADAYELLCLGDLRVDPRDKELARWRAWAVKNPPPWAKKVPIDVVTYQDLENNLIVATYRHQPLPFQSQLLAFDPAQFHRSFRNLGGFAPPLSFPIIKPPLSFPIIKVDA